MKKKILFITNVDWFFVSHRLPIGIEAIKKGYEVHLAAHFTGQEKLLISKSFNIHKVDCQRCEKSFWGSLNYLIRIIKIIYKIQPDIVHAITIKPVLFGGLALKIYRRASFVASISGLGYIFIANNIGDKIIRYLITLTYKIALSNRSMKVIFQNSHDKNFITKICKLNNQNSELIDGSGVDLNLFKPAKNIPDSNIVLFASRLLVTKGINEYLACAERLKNKNYKFIVAGKLDLDNPDCISRKKILYFHNKGIVEYIGDKNDVQEIINRSKIVILPSYYGEGFPKILIEAAACGKPIITTDHPGCRDAIIPNKTGLLVPVKDIDTLVSAIVKLFNSPDLCYSMGIEARKLALRKYDIYNVVNKHILIYRSLLKC